MSPPEDIELTKSKFANSDQVWVKIYHAGHCSFMWGKEMLYYDDLFDILEGR